MGDFTPILIAPPLELIFLNFRFLNISFKTIFPMHSHFKYSLIKYNNVLIVSQTIKKIISRYKK